MAAAATRQRWCRNGAGKSTEEAPMAEKGPRTHRFDLVRIQVEELGIDLKKGFLIAPVTGWEPIVVGE
jgi:hypothetical protein